MPRTSGRAAVLGAAFAAGAVALTAQTLLLRAELDLYGGNEVALGVFLGLWLLGIAAGALAVRERVSALWVSGFATPCLLAQAALLVLAAWLAAVARQLSGVPAYEPFPLRSLLLWSAPIALPVALVTGATIPALAARGRQVGTSVTAVYVLEALGSFAGGAGTSLLLASGCGSGSLMVACGALAAGAGAVLQRGAARAGLGALCLCLAVSAVPLGGVLGQQLRQRTLEAVLPGSRLLDYAETATGSLALASLQDQQVLLADGRVLAAFPDRARVERAAGALAALTGAPRKVLVIGTEATDLVSGLMALAGLESALWVVPDPGFATFVERHVPGMAARARLEVLVADPLRARDELAAHGPFDAIWLVVDTPLRRAEDRFLTATTLQSLADLLTPDGVLAVPVRSAENALGPRLRLAVGTVLAGVGAALDVVRLVPGEDAWVLGAHRAASLSLSPEALVRAYSSMDPVPARIDLAGFASLLEPGRVADAKRLAAALGRDPAVQPSQIDRPLALYHNLLVRADAEDPELARLAEALRSRGAVLWVPLAVLVLFLVGRVAFTRSSSAVLRASASWSLGAAGAIGMTLDLVLLHAYQGRFGTLYLEAGWLFGLWMIGLACGAGAGRTGAAQRHPVRFGGAAFLLLAAASSGLALGGGGTVLEFGRLPWSALFVVAGALTGALVPVAEVLLSRARVHGAGAGRAIGFADHLGGAAAALLLGVFGIPVLGLAAASWASAGLAVLGLVLLLLTVARGSDLETDARAGPGHSTGFPSPGIGVALLGLCSAVVAGHLAVRTWVAGPRVHLDVETLAATGLPAPWKEQSEPVVHYRSPGGQAGGLGGVALASRAVARVQGYGGPMNLLLATDEQGRVVRLTPLAHRETASYVGGLGEFLDRFSGTNLLEGYALRTSSAGDRSPGTTGGGQMVDAMTGATVTSQAVARALAACGRKLAAPVYGVAYAGAASARPLDRRWLVLAGSLVLFLPVAWRAGRRARLAWLAAQAGVAGYLLGMQFSTVQVLALLRLEPDGNLLAWTGLLGLGVILSAALLGPVYCGHLCPAGAVQELLGALGARVGITRSLPVAVERRARFTKYLLLAAVVLGVLGGGSETLQRLDLLREVWNPDRGAWALSLLVLIALCSLVSVRFGCRYLCPSGAFLNLSNHFAPLRGRLPAKRYQACDLGVRSGRDLDCIHCCRCLQGQPAADATPVGSWVIRLTLAACIVMLLATLDPRGSGIADRQQAQVQIQTVDAVALRRKQAAGTLSRKSAEYWHVIRQ